MYIQNDFFDTAEAENTVSTRTGNTTVSNFENPSFSLVANNVIEQVDDDIPVHMINISRVRNYHAVFEYAQPFSFGQWLTNR